MHSRKCLHSAFNGSALSRGIISAVALEAEIKSLETATSPLRNAVPHYFLAQIYEQQSLSEEAMAQWEEALRYLDTENWTHREWLNVVDEKLNQQP